VEERLKKERKSWERETREWGLKNLKEIVANPEKVVIDTRRKAIIYLKEFKGNFAGVVVGQETQNYIYTVQPMKAKLNPKRYIVLYERKTEK